MICHRYLYEPFFLRRQRIVPFTHYCIELPGVNLTEIIIRCKRADPQGQRYLFDMFSDVLFRVASRYLRDPAAAEDAVMQAFMTDPWKVAASSEETVVRLVYNFGIPYVAAQHGCARSGRCADRTVSEATLEDHNVDPTTLQIGPS